MSRRRCKEVGADLPLGAWMTLVITGPGNPVGYWASDAEARPQKPLTVPFGWQGRAGPGRTARAKKVTGGRIQRAAVVPCVEALLGGRGRRSNRAAR